jgi:flavin-dependent dehydrogenase
MTDHYDVVIVGSGPAGSTAAYELAQGGLKVLALDKEKFPRYKPCGGALSSRIQSILPFNFTGVVENTISGILFTHTFKQDIPVKSDKPLAYLVKRERFDNLLVEKAKERGATVRVGERVKSFLCRGNTIDVITNRGTYTTKFLIGADGPFSVVKRMFMPDGAQTLGLAMEGELEATGASLTGMNDMAMAGFSLRTDYFQLVLLL